MPTIRPSALTHVTTVQVGDIFLIDGPTGFRALAASAVVDGTAWTAYTPSSAFNVPGTSVMGPAAGRWKQIGKVVHFSVDAAVTTVGTASGAWIIGLPVAANGSNLIVGASGKEVQTLGALLAIQGASTTSCSVVKYDNTSLVAGGNGTRIQFNGTYEAA